MDSAGFDRWADRYEETVAASERENRYPFAGYRQVLSAIADGVTQKSRPEVLELGFGTGTLTELLAARGCTVYGQDFSAQMCRITRERLPETRLYAGDFREGLAKPLRVRRYDAIVAAYALHHLTDAEKLTFIRGLLPLLREGGALWIGDVAFATREDWENCRREAGEEWDEDEWYFVAEEWKVYFPRLRFRAFPPCAGVLFLPR